MSTLALAAGASGTGSVTIQAPATNNTDVINLPDTNGGTIMVSSAMPAFSAWQSSSQSITAGTFTKVQFQTKLFDTNNNFDSTTNYRFTPTVAGYYQLNASLYVSTAIVMQPAIYKNGTAAAYGAYVTQTNGVGALMYFNGSTDYVEVYVYLASNGALQNASSAYNYFNGSLVRAA